MVHSSHMAKIVDKNFIDAKLARLSYEVIAESQNGSIVEIKLFTGRYHQIRVQMSNNGHSIVGDEKYNSKIKQKNINLACYKLCFLHPILKKSMVFEKKPDFVKNR